MLSFKKNTACVFIFNNLIKVWLIMKNVWKFINGVKKELGRVKWPTKKYMVKYSISVLFLCVFFSGFFYLIDFLAALLKTLLR